MSGINGSSADNGHSANGSVSTENGSDLNQVKSTTNGSDSDDLDKEFVFVKYYLGERYKEDQKSNYEELQEFLEEVKKNISPNEDFVVVPPSTSTADMFTSRNEGGWEQLEVRSTVTIQELYSLMQRASFNHYQAFDNENEDANIFIKCSTLMKLDYKCQILTNAGGALCWNYPQTIVIPIAELTHHADAKSEGLYDESSMVPGFLEKFDLYERTAKSAAIARCRSRFPVPVILFNKKFICRSGTLAVRKGAAFEAARRGVGPEGQAVGDQFTVIKTLAGYGAQYLGNYYAGLSILITGVDEIKNADVNILKLLNIKYISDLMVEKRKIHTGISVSSSEKINMVKYGEFVGLRMPYPGCEFFKKYSKIRSFEDYKDKQLNLVFDWDAAEVDSVLELTSNEMPFSEIDWEQYTTWDLETLTRNYILLLLHFLKEGEGGFLVHCISGWDRTPLFISLLRISLWADKLIHKSLDVEQMAYLTLGYDWYLFGHDLPNRLRKAEEIMHFCFKFLPEISSERFSLLSSEAPQLAERRRLICDLSRLLLKIYEETIESPNPISEPDEAVN